MRRLSAILALSLLCLPVLAQQAPTAFQVDSPTITGAYTSPVTANTAFVGAVAQVTVTAPVVGTLNLKLQTFDAFDNTYDIPGGAFPPITTPGTYTILIYPGAPMVDGHSVNRNLDRVLIFTGSASGAGASFPCQIGFTAFGG